MIAPHSSPSTMIGLATVERMPFSCTTAGMRCGHRVVRVEPRRTARLANRSNDEIRVELERGSCCVRASAARRHRSLSRRLRT